MGCCLNFPSAQTQDIDKNVQSYLNPNAQIQNKIEDKHESSINLNS